MRSEYPWIEDYTRFIVKCLDKLATEKDPVKRRKIKRDIDSTIDDLARHLCRTTE